jgi:DNA-binding NarL/FixJ family response regulator
MARDQAQQPPIRVLIVDDDARVRTALRTFLTAYPGFEVVGEAGSVGRALELAREVTPCVAVVDVLVPDVQDGLKLLRVLTGELSVPAVAMSLSGALRSEALAAGASDFLTKDGSSERLLFALRKASHTNS